MFVLNAGRVSRSAAVIVAICAASSQTLAQQAPTPPPATTETPTVAPAAATAPAAAPPVAPSANADAPPAAQDPLAQTPASQTPAAPSAATLPTVTIETTEEAPKRKAPTPPAAEPASEPAATASAEALAGASTETDGARGGPTQINGYIAKQTTTATKTATPLKNVPQSVSVTTAEQASDQGSKALGQALTYVPGVNVAQGEGHRDQITIRGQNTTSDFYVDGLRDDVEYFRDLYNVDSIEVVKGPNAMIFGRGGSGGVVNRSTKQADGRTIRDASVTYGMYGTKRTSVDAGQALNSAAAFRLNAMYENSEGFRDHFELERFGINPTAAFKISDQTKLLMSYEFYKDVRTVDRGVPSRNGAPLEGFQNTFFGNPDLSQSSYEGHRLSAILEHQFSDQFKVRSASVFADGDKVYSNVFAFNAVNAAGNLTLDGYRDTLDRQTFVNQTDWTYRHDIGPDMRNTIVIGTELTHQQNQNFRDVVPAAARPVVNITNPTIFGATPAISAPNRRRDSTLESAGAYVQSQFEVSRYVEVIGGLRFDHYDVSFNDALVANSAYARQDDVWSPRAGIVFKPSEVLSVYLSYSKAYVPSVADQLNFLNIGTGANRRTGADLDPEEFLNKEIGFKWEVTPRLMLTGALFQLDRTNTPTVTGAGGVEQFGATRTEGGELGLTGYVTDQWQVAAGFAHQIALITAGSAPTIGKDVASVPHNTLSLWNKYMFSPMFGAGLGVIHKTSFFANADNLVEVDGYTRLDGALFFNLNDAWSAQLNVENILNEDYFVSAHNNNNIMPGAPASAYVTIGAKF